MIKWFCYLLYLTIFLIHSVADAGVIFHDDITLKGKPYLLRAETKKGILKRGGQLVEFLVDGRSIGKNLSGGDGIALKEFIPHRRGLYRVTARTGGDEDEGYLLSLNKGEDIVVIDIEGGIFEGPFPIKERNGSKEAIKNISTRYPLLYLQTLMDKELLERLLKKRGFTMAPILNWDDGEVINRVYGMGIRIKAIVGGPSVIESLEDNRFKVFSFEDREGAEWVKDWKEIEERLK